MPDDNFPISWGMAERSHSESAREPAIHPIFIMKIHLTYFAGTGREKRIPLRRPSSFPMPRPGHSSSEIDLIAQTPSFEIRLNWYTRPRGSLFTRTEVTSRLLFFSLTAPVITAGQKFFSRRGFTILQNLAILPRDVPEHIRKFHMRP